MNSKATLLFILSFIFVYMWMPLHFDSDHFESRLSAEVHQVGAVLYKDLGDWVTRNALKLTSLKETTVFRKAKSEMKVKLYLKRNATTFGIFHISKV